MNRRHLAMVSGAALLVVVAWFALLWSPKGADLADAKERRSAAQSEVAQLQARLDRLTAAKRDSARLEAAANRVGAAVPATADLAGFLLATDDAARAAGVEFLTVTPSPVATSTSGGPSEIALTLSIKGRYGQVLGFLDRLLDLPRVVVVDSVDVSAEQGTAGAPSLSVSLSGRIFTTELPAGAAPTTTTPAPATTNEVAP